MPGNVPPVADERDGLMKYLEQQRAGVRYAAYGLTEEQIRQKPARSEICIGGLIKHVTACERGWVDTMLQRRNDDSVEEAAAQWGADWQVTADDTLASLLADYESCARETEEAVAGIDDLSQPVPVPRDDATRAFNVATCIGCGACVAACKNASAALFTSAKISHLGLLPQGQPERDARAVAMVDRHDAEGFGSCSNEGECEAVCPKEISISNIARMNRDYLKATLARGRG